MEKDKSLNKCHSLQIFTNFFNSKAKVSQFVTQKPNQILNNIKCSHCNVNFLFYQNLTYFICPFSLLLFPQSTQVCFFFFFVAGFQKPMENCISWFYMTNQILHPFLSLPLIHFFLSFNNSVIVIFHQLAATIPNEYSKSLMKQNNFFKLMIKFISEIKDNQLVKFFQSCQGKKKKSFVSHMLSHKFLEQNMTAKSWLTEN